MWIRETSTNFFFQNRDNPCNASIMRNHGYLWKCECRDTWFALIVTIIDHCFWFLIIFINPFPQGNLFSIIKQAFGKIVGKVIVFYIFGMVCLLPVLFINSIPLSGFILGNTPICSLL